MRDATFAYLNRLVAEHKKIGYTTDPYRAAALKGIRIIKGDSNCASAGPPAVIVLTEDRYLARQRFTIFHEINHVEMQRYELEDAIAAEVDEDDADAHIEAVANFGAGLMLMPEPMIRNVLREYGHTPEAVLKLMGVGRVSLPAAMRRYVSHDLEAERAAFITSGTYIADTATCGRALPFIRYDRVPEVQTVVPDASLMVVSPKKVLGVVSW